MSLSETFRRAFPERETPKVSYAIPFPAAAAQHVESTFNASRVHIICSGSLAKNTKNLDDLKAALRDKVAGVRIGMTSHTLWSEVLEITKDSRAANADLLITLGGGSLTDAAKLVSFTLTNNVSTAEELATLSLDSPTVRENIQPSQVPIISIPTSLSGGEWTNFARGTEDATHQKHSFFGKSLGPVLVILDPKLSTTTPDSIWLSTGIRAVDHCVETICSLKGNPQSDKEAEDGLKRLIPGLLKSRQDRHDLDARLSCQLGVIDAMSACSRGVPLGASHGIGHQLATLGVGHGETSCILLPSVCKYNAAKGANVDRQKTVIAALWLEPVAVGIFKEKGLSQESADLGDLLGAIIRALGMPRSLADVKVGRDKLDGLAANSLHHRQVQANPVPLTKEQVLEILETVVQ